MREIRVKGTGKVSVSPDQIELIFTLIAENKSYETTMQQANDLYTKLIDSLIKLGFKEEDIKTTNFSINAIYDQIKDMTGNFVSVFRGYRNTHGLKLNFDLDIVRLGKILEAIKYSKADPNIQINFTVKDESKLKKTMLENAMINAKELAEVLAKSGNVTLGNILTISYDWADIQFYSPTRYALASDMEAKTFQITPEDIKLSESVNVVWEIK